MAASLILSGNQFHVAGPGCLVVQTVEHHEAELERDPLQYIEPM